MSVRLIATGILVLQCYRRVSVQQVSVHGDVPEELIMKARGIAASACKARLPDFPRRRIDPFYIFACGILWRKEANQDAGRELLQAGSSPNAMIRRVCKKYAG